MKEPARGLPPRLVPIEAKRGPHVIVGVHEGEVGRHDADDLGRAIVDLNEATDDSWVSPNRMLPTMAQNEDARGVGPIIAFRQRSA